MGNERKSRCVEPISSCVGCDQLECETRPTKRSCNRINRGDSIFGAEQNPFPGFVSFAERGITSETKTELDFVNLMTIKTTTKASVDA